MLGLEKTMAIGTGSLWPTSDMSGIGFVFSFLVLHEILAFVSLRFFKYVKNLSSYNDRFMLSTSSVTRNSYVSTRICLITPKTFFRSLAWAVQSTWSTSSDITMEAILLSIHLGSFHLAQILTTRLLMTESGFLHRLYIIADHKINFYYLEFIWFCFYVWSSHFNKCHGL